MKEKNLKKKYRREEKRHEKAYEKENRKHEKRHIIELDEALRISKKKRSQ